jgi:hypothetical protein
MTMTMAPMKKRIEKEGRKKKMIRVEVKNGSALRAKQEDMEISSEEEEKKMETSLSSNEIRQQAKASVSG